MDKKELEQLWSETLRSPVPNSEQFDRLAQGVADRYRSGDLQFREHIKNRSKRVTNSTGQSFNAQNFDLAMARAFIADEIGFGGWDELIEFLQHPEGYPLLFRYAIAAMWRGDFSGLELAVGGPENFYDYVVDWYEKGLFTHERETLDEILSAACMLGSVRTAEFLLDNGVDPYASMRSWLAGPHYAVSSGRLEMVKLLIAKKVPMDIENKYGGNMLGQALWSAINEHMDSHAEIIEDLIAAGAHVWPNTLEWWNKQPVPSPETKHRVAEALRKAEEK